MLDTRAAWVIQSQGWAELFHGGRWVDNGMPQGEREVDPMGSLALRHQLTLQISCWSKYKELDLGLVCLRWSQTEHQAMLICAREHQAGAGFEPGAS